MQELIKRAKELLADGTVARVLGWKAGDLAFNPEPAYFETPESLEDFVYDGFCGANLSKYMIEASRLEGKTMVCLKPCDTYSFNQLLKEHRVDREKAYIVGVGCKGTVVMEQTGCVICSTGRELMQPDGHTTGKYIPVNERITYKDLLKHNSINCSSVLLRREDALAFPMEHDDSHEDYITWLKILRRGGFAAGINKPYLKCRLSEGGKSRNKLKSAAMTYQVYKYMGYGRMKSLLFFISYAFHGVWKYR